ncbi:MAG: PilN domain-containing protein [Armatimonadaceae bacterium]|jgi:Tfp pilus assembly protein PilN
MPNINLIAERRAQKHRIERLTRTSFVAMTFSLLGVVGMLSWTMARRIELSRELADADTRMRRLQPDLAEIARIRQRIAESRPKVETLENARLSTLRWCAVFNALPRVLPAETWLEKMEAVPGDPAIGTPTKLTVHAVSRTQSQAGQAAVLMAAQPIFTEIDIRSTRSESTSSGKTVVKFEMSAALRPQEGSGSSGATAVGKSGGEDDSDA